jgi:hypothetical protein
MFCEKMNLPTFTPERVDAADERIQIVGNVSAQVYMGQNWIGERWIGYIGRDGEPPVEGRWVQEGERWRFVSENPRTSKFKVGEPLRLYDGYWGERAYIVLAPMNWTEARFEAKKQWDHDHCGICWATIDADAPRHYRSSERDVICADCYGRYVQLRSLAFIEPTQNKRMESNG